MEQEPLNLTQKLIWIRKSVSYLKKSEDGQQYKYVPGSQVVAAVRDKMNELGVLLMPSIKSHELYLNAVYRDKNKDIPPDSPIYKEHITKLDMEMTWIDADNPESSITLGWGAQGIDSGEKGPGKAVTYAEKTFILKFFNIPTDELDPDAFQDQVDDTTGENEESASKGDEIVSDETYTRLISAINRADADRHGVHEKLADLLKMDINEVHLNKIPEKYAVAIAETLEERVAKQIEDNKKEIENEIGDDDE
jgi:hypothetical protein